MATTSKQSYLTARLGRLVRPMLLVLAGASSLAIGACREDEDGGNDAQVKASCTSYCAQSKLCNADINEQNCIDDCRSAMGNCMADEQDIALDKLEECSKEACNDFAACTIDAGAQCYFGL